MPISKAKLARRILMLLVPWPISKLMPTGYQTMMNALEPKLTEVATHYKGPAGGSIEIPHPTEKGTSITVFMPIGGALETSWPSNIGATSLPQVNVPQSPAAGSLVNLTDEKYWTDQEDASNYEIDGETGDILSDDEFSLYPTNEFPEDDEVEGAKIVFEDTEVLDEVKIYEQIDQDAVDLETTECTAGVYLRNHGISDNFKYAAQSHFSVASDIEIHTVYFNLKKAGGDISGLKYQCQIWNITGIGAGTELTTQRRVSSQVDGVNTWSDTWVGFTFSPVAILRAGSEVAIALTVDTTGAVNYASYTQSADPDLTGYEQVFKTDLTAQGTYETKNMAMRITYKSLATETLIQEFENVTSGQNLSFSGLNPKLIRIVIKASGAGGGNFRVSELHLISMLGEGAY